MNINDEVNTVSSVHFGILSHEQILKMSCVEITENKYYDSNGEPNLNSLFDPRMGVIERGRNCKTCEQNFIDCPGHFGHINLAKPVYNVKYSDIYKKILTCICPRCGKLSLNKNSAQLKILLKQTEGRFKERFDIIYDLCSKVSRCGVLDEDEKDSLYDNQGCGAIKPSRINQKTIIEGFITLEWANAKSKDEGNEPISKQMDATYILNLFSRISEEDSMAMGFNKNWCLPHYLIIQSVVVVPPACRPSVRQYNGQRSEDDITVKYSEIIKYNNEIKNFLKEDTVNSKKLDISMSNMQFHINAIIDNDGPYPQKSQTRNGRDIKSLSERLNGKEGRIRSNLMGKRVDFSARSVISPESNVDMSELCIPKEFAMNLTFPEKVNRFNIQKMYKLVRNGNKIYPGAKSIKQVKTGKLTKLLENNTENIVLEYGDVINRHLQDGDYVLFNRQPSLHRMSMMGHKVRIMPGKTMRFNTDVCNPYNADFDGDEMNIHVPQSIQAKCELKYLAAVPNHFISPSNNSPIIAPTQDNLLALFLITNGDVLFTQIEAMHFLSGCESFDGTLPEPKIREGKYIRWTGHQILSCILPPFTLNSDGVKIINGELLSGQIAKGVNGQIIQAIHDEFGPKITERYMNDLQRVCSRYLIKNGYSVGISDLVLPESLKQQNKDFVKKAKEAEIELNRKLHLNILTNSKNVLQEYETQLTKIQNNTDDTITKNTVSKLNINNNRVFCMVKSGAKGKDINIKQMMCLLGQQAIDGGRVPINFTDRTLPHFPRFDYGLESGGFIVNNYLEGLSPTEFFFHGMSGREGLIDTAVKTATSGYLQRKLVKSMEDLKANYDLSVRDNNGDVIEFLYGSDGFDPVRIGKHKTNFEFITEDNLMNNYIIRENEKFEKYMTKKAVDAMKKDKEWFNKLNEYNQNVQEVLDILHTKYTLFKYSDTKFNNKSIESDLFLPVNIKKLIDKVDGIYHLSEIKTKSSLTPVEVYEVINEILTKCANNGVINNVLRVMLYDLLSPKKLIRDNKFNRLALDHLKNLIITAIQKASVSAGEMVGVISGQSIGEVSTQLTLNSVEWNTELLLRIDGKMKKLKIGEWIDQRIKLADLSDIESHPNDTTLEYIKDSKVEVLACDENGKIIWDNVTAVTKHPPINKDGSNTLVKITTESGREVIATKAKSFLKRIDNKIQGVNGSDLKVGDYVPICNTMPDFGKKLNEWELSEYLYKGEYVYMSEVDKALAERQRLAPDASKKRPWFKNNPNFILPFKRSDSFTEAVKDKYCNISYDVINEREEDNCSIEHNAFNNKKKNEKGECIRVYRKNCIYPKNGFMQCGHVPEKIKLDKLFGFFVGAYLAEGHSTEHHVLISNIDDDFNNKIDLFCRRHNLAYHIDDSQKNNGRSKTLRIHSKVLAQLFIKAFGKSSDLKKIPAEFFGANRNFLKGLIDGYFSGDGSVDKRGLYVFVTSISRQLLNDIQLILSMFNIYSSIKTEYNAQQYNIKRGLKARLGYTLKLYKYESYIFAKNFTLTVKYKQDLLNKLINQYDRYSEHSRKDIIPDVITEEFGHIKKFERYGLESYLEISKNENDKKLFRQLLNENVKYDKIVKIEDFSSTKKYVYDLTTETTKNFNIFNGLCEKDTFHLAGTGNKATSGVIRVNELIGVRKNIKAPSNLVYLKDEYRFDKDKAEKVKNSLEETKIEEILNSDPEFFLATSNNIEDMPEEDQTFMKFYEVFTELNSTKADVNSNPWIVKLDFNRKEMLNRDISMADVHQILSINKPDANIMYSDDNAGKLVFRIKFNFNSQINIEDDYNLLREEAKNIKDLTIKGINGLTDIYVLDAAPQIRVKDTTKMDNTDIGQVYETIDEYYLKTDGANLLELLMTDEVDSNRSFTIDPNEMNMIFGIEMARFIIIKEFCDTVKTSPRHVELLASKMTHNGHFMSIDRYGINKEDVGPLAKISFEQVNDNIKNAALFGEVDNLRGVSGNIIVGQVPKIGTGNVRIYIDEEFLTQELKKRGIKDSDMEHDTQEINDDIILQEFQQKICVSEDEQIKLNLNDITVDEFSLADIPEVEVE
jgi:DNA-directed RNA polymerase beta' subunit